MKATENFQKAAIFYITQRINIMYTCRIFCKRLLPARDEVMGAGEASGATAQGGKLGGKIKIKKKKICAQFQIFEPRNGEFNK